jgi:alkaline phosphatase
MKLIQLRLRIFCLLIALFIPVSVFGAVKNLVLMIADGQGFNAIRATDLYTGEQAVYEGERFVKFGVSTFSLSNPAGYDPEAMWKDPAYASVRPTDSAAAATALYTGVKTTNGTLSLGPYGARLETIFEHAAKLGKKIGVVTSVPFSDATPAAALAHAEERGDYPALADQMFAAPGVQVIMGGGNPFFGPDGESLAGPSYRYISEAAWKKLASGKLNGFTLLESKEDFERLAQGKGRVPAKVAGIARVAKTLQYGRSGEAKLASVPSLATMARGALQVLSASPKGFALMVEGGAIDWAAHGNSLERLIEEQGDFNEAVRTVAQYLDDNTRGNNWENTLLVVVADHETGGLWGKFGQYTRFLDRGKGVLPGHSWQSRDHTNSLVPLYARGAGSEYFAPLATRSDPYLVEGYLAGSGFDGRYLDNTDVHRVLRRALDPEVRAPGPKAGVGKKK